jgi:ubiquilin
MVQSLMTDEPERMQAIIEQNPRIGHVLNNPDVFHEILAATRTPAYERELMRMADRAMSNIESHPQGFNMLRRMYDSVQEPLVDVASGVHNNNDVSQETPAPACDPNPLSANYFSPRVGRKI